ncbi:MAG: flavodoxin domain-containing protein [Faecousia sp.]
MKTVVIYNSQTGFTKRYAQWIAEAAGADCFALAEAKKKNLDGYETIVYGGWACAGGISGLNWFKGNLGKWEAKRRIVFCVGGSPMESPEIEVALRRNFSGPEWERVHAFYCPGGFNYEKMPVHSKLMMKMFLKALEAKKDKTEEEKIMLKMISSSYDISDKKYIAPILACLGEQE